MTLTFSADSGVLERRTETTAGWRPRRRAGPAASAAGIGRQRLEPRAAGRDDTRLLGVRLRDELPAPAAGDRLPAQYPPLERAHPDTLLRMKGARGDAFVARWQALLEADTEFGRRFRAYRDTKVARRDRAITPTGEYAELESLVHDFTRHGATVVLVNNPESALLRDQYADGPYYRSYLDFLAGVAARQPNTRFLDLGAALPIEDFNDWHHVTYIGAIKVGPKFAGGAAAAVGGRTRPRIPERCCIQLDHLPAFRRSSSSAPMGCRRAGGTSSCSRSLRVYGVGLALPVVAVRHDGHRLCSRRGQIAVASTSTPPRLPAAQPRLEPRRPPASSSTTTSSSSRAPSCWRWWACLASPWTLSVILLVGISFYTFQSMAYVIDVYHQRAPAVRDFRNYALRWPTSLQLVAGPISRMGQLPPQLQRRCGRRRNACRSASG